MNRLKELRNEFNLTVRSLGELLEISSTSISCYEQESRDFNSNVLKIISDFFSVSIDYLLCHSSDGIFVNYENDSKLYRLNDISFKKYKNDDLIYYKDNKRYLDINKIVGIKKEANISELLEFINQQELIDKTFDEISTSKLSIPLDKIYVVEKIIKLDDSKFNAIKNMIELL